VINLLPVALLTNVLLVNGIAQQPLVESSISPGLYIKSSPQEQLSVFGLLLVQSQNSFIHSFWRLSELGVSNWGDSMGLFEMLFFLILLATSLHGLCPNGLRPNCCMCYRV